MDITKYLELDNCHQKHLMQFSSRKKFTGTNKQINRQKTDISIFIYINICIYVKEIVKINTLTFNSNTKENKEQKKFEGKKLLNQLLKKLPGQKTFLRKF